MRLLRLGLRHLLRLSWRLTRCLTRRLTRRLTLRLCLGRRRSLRVRGTCWWGRADGLQLWFRLGLDGDELDLENQGGVRADGALLPIAVRQGGRNDQLPLGTN